MKLRLSAHYVRADPPYVLFGLVSMSITIPFVNLQNVLLENVNVEGTIDCRAKCTHGET